MKLDRYPVRCETDKTKATGHDEDPNPPIGVGMSNVS